MNITSVRLVVLLLLVFASACTSFERYPTDKSRFTFKGKGVLVAAQDRATGVPRVEALFRQAAGDAAGSIHVLPLMPASAFELPVNAAKIGLQKKGTQGLDPMAQVAVNAILKAGTRFGVKFDYIVFVTAEKANIMGQVINIEYYAALYEISTKRVVAAARDTGSTTPETAAEQLPLGARRVVSVLLYGDY
ncbi:MAG TPA: hypothetical protein PKM44_12710 [Turneriella sp.]|nr:hypothetical protein [Turneriella sp.]HNE20355.1 hypothetical protein [Turneriella sp.]HNJ64905.1 hypothetical protein [Turneriella sp.]HNL11370.1 hypothetical protein [Turneriella sp.]HNN01295.1 hypothetical protein [Turneriella sp.]